MRGSVTPKLAGHRTPNILVYSLISFTMWRALIPGRDKKPKALTPEAGPRVRDHVD